MMTKRNRIWILVASLALGLMYVMPVWTIDLEAPQYPEGIGMVIQIDNIEGKKEHDLRNINNLNHYIGMYPIEPDEIPELRWMPWIVLTLIALGLFVVATGRKKLLYTWTVLFAGISIVGMADFYKWKYEYGHNLDEENAIIKIPGMSYQPPLIGSRQILNFTAHSWPGAGGWAAILACATAVVVSVREWRRKDGAEESDAEVLPLPGSGPEGPVAASVLALLILAGCGELEPRPFVPGTDDCESCLMAIDSDGYATQALTRTGKVYTFDSVECLVNWLQAEDVALHSTWVTDFANPGDLVRADEAFFLVSETLKSPMGLGVTAFARAEDRDGAAHAFGGDAMDWDGVRDFVSDAWPDARPVRHGGHAVGMR